jgi:hypothetical protein
VVYAPYIPLLKRDYSKLKSKIKRKRKIRKYKENLGLIPDGYNDFMKGCK